MALRNILTKEEPRLRKKSRAVTEFNSRLWQLIDDMRETLLSADGVGLAAPQVGVLRRVVLVMDINMEGKTPEEQIIELVNPKIIETSGTQEGAEGCLSVPGEYGIVTRPENVTVKAQDRFGNEFTVSGYGMTARCFCHECDHLDGKLFIDIATRMLDPDEMDGPEDDTMED
jgi:peptide deformylase